MEKARKGWGDMSLKEKQSIAYLVFVIILVSVVWGSLIVVDKADLAKRIGRDEAIATCENAFRDSNAHYAFSGDGMQYNVEETENAWIIHVKGVIMDQSGMWGYTKVRYIVPFNRADTEKLYSKKNISKSDILVRGD